MFSWTGPAPAREELLGAETGAHPNGHCRRPLRREYETLVFIAGATDCCWRTHSVLFFISRRATVVDFATTSAAYFPT